MKNWYALSAKAAQLETEVTIFDEIGGFGVSADQFIADLQKIPADHKILLRIHSPGGEVFDGNAIATALSRRGNVEVQIEGIAASMATLISLSGRPVKMAENGFYMIHNPWGAAMGDAEELRKQAELLDRIRGNMVNAYSAKTGQSPEQIGEWMDAETWFTAEQALQAGFVDEVTDRLDLAASATRFSRLAKFRHAPAALLTPTPERMTENENPEAPLEEIAAATVVSESAPVEQPAEEPATEILAEETPEEIVELAPEQPAAPVAKIAAADSILAKYNAAIAERDSLRAELSAFQSKVSAIKSELDAEREALARLERSLGLHAAQVVPIIQPHSDASSDPVAEYLAAVEAGDRKAASALFEKHKALIWQHRQKISKA
jgi:ATP-dependent Clp endopeptidase proteolytic subunit ClpP